jgi:hypothetical protein
MFSKVLSIFNPPTSRGLFYWSINMKAINKQTVFAIFNDANHSAASFATRLFNAGVFDKATARTLAVEWAAEKYTQKIIKGQRGLTLAQDSAGLQAVTRVMKACFESAPSNKSSNNKTDKVKSLVTSFGKLTPAEKRRFLASI